MNVALPTVSILASATPEPVRLVIWDLDDTFWRGALGEGGVTAFVAHNHRVVAELARRGIVSSICSKNDPERALPVIAELGLAEFFVFASISYAPKGPRIAAIIEDMGLRAASVLFIDDHPANRAEAEVFAPGLQTADETFAARMLDDLRFRGKDDAGLTRLAQYKLLERRQRERAQSPQSADDFLRGCDIRVRFEYDVERHVERAIELVNRTNQLNFTKWRLPEDPGQARAELLSRLHSFNSQSALLRVVDRYGDYGFAGFYLSTNGRDDYVAGAAASRLESFCFSCRILGMGLERWLYAHLGRPEIAVVGEVAADLDGAEVDWITIDARSGARAPAARLAPEIRARGGCEMLALASYLRPHAERLEAVGNVHVGRVFVSLNSAPLALNTLERSPAALAPVLAALELPAEIAAPRTFENAPEGTVFVFSAAHDAYPDAARYRHRDSGFEIHFNLLGWDDDFAAMSALDFAAKIDADATKLTPDEVGRLKRLHAVLSADFERARGFPGDDAFAALARLVERTPTGGKFVLMLDAPRVRRRNGAMAQSPTTARYNPRAEAALAPYPFATAVCFADAIHSDEEIVGNANHYARAIYLRAAELVKDAIVRLPGRRDGFFASSP